MLSKKKTIIILSLITLFGAVSTFFASSFLFHDVLSKDGDIFATMPASFPLVSLSAIFILAFFYVIRLQKRPKTFVELSKLYLLLCLIFSGVGFIFTFVAGIATYGSFVKPYPFPGYLIIMAVVFALLIWAAIFFMAKLKGKESEETYSSKVSHVFSTFGWVCFTILVFNRFGTLLLSPLFIQWRTFYLTFPFYCYLLCPLFIGVVKVLIDLEILTNRSRLVLVIASGAAQIALFLAVVIIGVSNTEMISGVSPAMPLERISSMPLEIIIHFAGMLAVSIVLLIQTIKAKKVNS